MAGTAMFRFEDVADGPMAGDGAHRINGLEETAMFFTTSPGSILDLANRWQRWGRSYPRSCRCMLTVNLAG